MARTSTVTVTGTDTLHYLLKTGRNVEALACAEALLDVMFDPERCEYLIGTEHAQSYKYIAIAHSRNQLPAQFWLTKMMDCVHPHRASQYCASYYDFVEGEQSRAHPFFVYLASIAASFRYSLRAFRTAKTK